MKCKSKIFNSMLQILLAFATYYSSPIGFCFQEPGGLGQTSAAEGHPDFSANSLLALQTAFSASSKKI